MNFKELMAKNARLRAAQETARTSVANREFVGPDGDYVCRFMGMRNATANGVDYSVLQFRVDGSVSGQSEYDGMSIDLMYYFNNHEKYLDSDKLADLMVSLQKMGVDTPNLTIEEIDEQTEGLRLSHFTLRVKKGKNGRVNFSVVGVANSDASDYSSDNSDDDNEWEDEEAEASKDDADQDDIPFGDDDTENDWDEDSEDSEDDEGEYTPSDWTGYEVQWKPPRAKKLQTFIVHDADDDKRTVILSRDGKVYSKPVPFDDLTLPEE